MVVKVYVASISGNSKVKADQQRIKTILEIKNIEFEEVDITSDASLKDQMRALAGNEKQLPPYIVNDDKPCGNFDDFLFAVEEEKLNEFLKLE